MEASGLDPLNVFQDLSRLGGHIGAIATAVFLAVRLYRLPALQQFFPEKFRWENLDGRLKYALLLGLSGVGAALASLSTDVSALDAAKAGFAAVIAAIGGDQITTSKPMQAAAKMVFEMHPPATSVGEKTPSVPPVDSSPKS